MTGIARSESRFYVSTQLADGTTRTDIRCNGDYRWTAGNAFAVDLNLRRYRARQADARRCAEAYLYLIATAVVIAATVLVSGGN